MANKLTKSTVYQTLSMNFGDENGIHVTFALDTKDGQGVGISGGGVWKGSEFIGSFDGFMGFAHSVAGPDKEAVDELLGDLSLALEEEYGIPAPSVEPLEKEAE